MPYALINGVRIYYEVHGEGEPIILLNGILMNTRSWAPQLSAFVNNGLKVILMDYRGQGLSDKPRIKYSIDTLVDDIKGLLDHLNIKKVHMLGISYGGVLAMRFAIKYQDYLKSLIIVDTTPIADHYIKRICDQWMMAARLHSGRYLFLTMIPTIYSAYFINERWDFVSSTATAFEKVDFDAFIELLKTVFDKDVNVLDELHKIKVPTLIIAGERDKFAPPEIYSKMIHERIEGSELVIIEKAGHVVIWEKPIEFNAIVIDFIKRHK